MKLTINVQDVLKTEGSHRFYRWLSNQFNGSIIFEAGTAKGASARAWASNPSNLVVTYDIAERSRYRCDPVPNLLHKVWDVNNMDLQWVKQADIIYLDISHNGHDEEKFLTHIDPYFNGILVMDDVDCKKRWDYLYYLFRNIEREHYLLPKSISAPRGTGVVAYGDWTIEIKEDV